MNMFRQIAFILAAVLLATVTPLAHGQDAGVAQSLPKIDLDLGSATLSTEIASTAKEGEIGLMYRSSMPDNSGMLFVLPLGRATFWMKDTLIPLSIAFLDKQGVVLELHDMKAMDTSITASDSDQVAYAIEANLHWFALNGIKPGMKIDPPPGVFLKPVTP